MKKISIKIYDYLKANSKLANFLLAFFVMTAFLVPAAVYAAPSSLESKIYLALGWIFYSITSVIANLTTFLFAWLLQVAKWDDFVDLPAVTEGWVQVRNLSNMFFILILLLIAFATILRVEHYNIKRLLPKVILMAILINFSKTICGIIIEFSQVIMMTFIGVLDQNGANIAKLLGIEEMWSYVKKEEKVNGIGLATLGGIIVAFIATLIALVVIVTAIAVFVMRVIMLWIYIVLSPLAYLMAAFPQGQKYAGQWWGDFTKYVITGPVLAFFLWLALTTAGESAKKLGTADIDRMNLGEGVLSNFLSAPIFQTYLITIGFLVGGLMVTQQIGGIAASVAGKGIGAIQKGKAMTYKGVKKGTVGTAKFVGRNSLGVAGAGLQIASSKGSSVNKLGKFASNWRTDINKGRQESRANKRLATLKKMGMGDKSMSSLKDVADSKLGKRTKTIIAGGAAVGTAIAGAPILVPAVAGLTAAVVGFKTLKKNKTDRDKKTVDDAKKKRNERVSSAEKGFEENTEMYGSRRDREIKAAKTERDADLLTQKDEYDAGRINDSTYSGYKLSINNNYNNKKRIAEEKFDGEASVQNANNIRGNTKLEARTDYQNDIKDVTNEKRRQKDINKLNTKYTAVAGRASDATKQAEYDGKLTNINAKRDAKYRNDYHPNKIMMEATKKGIQDETNAKRKVTLLADGENIENFPKGDFYSASGQTATQKKFFDKLTANTDESTKALAEMTRSLRTVQDKIKRGDNVSPAEFASIQALKQGIASYKKGGGNTASLSGVINVANEIHTGDGSDSKHRSTVEDFESKVA